jgi:hypothetical protein
MPVAVSMREGKTTKCFRNYHSAIRMEFIRRGGRSFSLLDLESVEKGAEVYAKNIKPSRSIAGNG